MTKTLAFTAFVAGSLFAGGTLPAQVSTNTPPAAGLPGAAAMRVRASFDQIAKQLELTEDQKPKVQVVIDEQQKQMTALRQDTSVATADRRTKMTEIRNAATAKLKDILTPDQLAKWEKLGVRQTRPQAITPAADAVTPPATPKN